MFAAARRSTLRHDEVIAQRKIAWSLRVNTSTTIVASFIDVQHEAYHSARKM
jgi:hypothetical protein